MKSDDRELRIRRYRLEDIDAMIPYIEQGLKEMPMYYMLSFDADRAKSMLKININNHDVGAFLLLDGDKIVGGIAMHAVVGYASLDLYATDVFFFVLPEYRSLRNAMRLILTITEWALKRGVKPNNIRSTVTNTLKLEGMTKLLARADYVPIGTIYMYDPGSFARMKANGVTHTN